jgi:uncharacterized protein
MHGQRTDDIVPTVQVLSPFEQRLAAEFARRVRAYFGDRVRDLRLFGSRARGEARPDSDMDIWVLLDDVDSADRDGVCDIAIDLLLEDSLPFVISPRVMSCEQHERLVALERLLPAEIERDGIPL